jgi:Nucleotidyl transferase AbiEii toxin, Type IV TA system
MTRVEKVLGDVVAALNAGERRYALIGGLAVSARTEPRFTRDVDWAVAVQGDPEAEAVVHGLVEVGYSILMTVEQDETHRLATVRLLPPGESQTGVVADLLFASSGIEPELVAAADAMEILPGVVLPVAKVGHLIALKVLSAAPSRPQDSADLRALATVAEVSDLELAKQALDLIEARGFARGKRLHEEMERELGSLVAER